MSAAACLFPALFLCWSAAGRPQTPADSSAAPPRIVSAQPMTGDRRVTVLFGEAFDARLSLYDLAGRLRGARAFSAAGRARVVWDLSVYDLPAGVYILVWQHRGGRGARKLLILR